ncbi:MAG: hypothetical protein J5825_05405 [Lachnospiraceae bacterium]|nr:hypothetical protein [Lachnospiraceae bacterium]
MRGSGRLVDGVIINAEYYEYDGDVLSHAWFFDKFDSAPEQMVSDLVLRMIPDRIMNPDRYEYTFVRTPEGMNYTVDHYYRKSQTITYEDKISEKTLEHLAANGFQLV